MDPIESLEQDAINAAINNNWDEAVKLNKKIIKLGHNTVATYNRMGKACSEMGMWDEAVRAFEKALELDPVNSVAQKGLENAKMDKRAGGVNLKAHQDTILHDTSTSQIIEITLKKEISADTDLVLNYNPKGFFMLKDSNGNNLKRISESKLNLKQDAERSDMKASLLEYAPEGSVKIKVISKDPVFRSQKQEIDPSLEVKSKEVIEEKKEIAKIMEESREEDIE